VATEALVLVEPVFETTTFQEVLLVLFSIRYPTSVAPKVEAGRTQRMLALAVLG
jgi:hypothetical protein